MDNKGYSFLLYNSQNATQTYIADISQLVKNVRMTWRLNNVDDLSFSLNIEAWREYCSNIGIDPYTTLRPLTSEIKVQYNGVFLPGAFEVQISSREFGIDDKNISVQARTTLVKLGYRWINKVYTQVDSAAIARDMISVTQAKTYGDYGITFGNTYTTGVLTDRKYDYYTISDAIKNLADDISGGFDFYFDHDWKFYTMNKRGSVKGGKTFVYGDEVSNVKEFKNPDDGSVIRNAMTIIGQGIGDPIVSAPNTDTVSAQTYYLREGTLTYSNIDNTSWLDTTSKNEVRDRKQPYDLPKLVVTEDELNINEYFVGDTIPVECRDTLSPYMGNGRIKEISISLDDNFYAEYGLELLKV